MSVQNFLFSEDSHRKEKINSFHCALLVYKGKRLIFSIVVRIIMVCNIDSNLIQKIRFLYSQFQNNCGTKMNSFIYRASYSLLNLSGSTLWNFSVRFCASHVQLKSFEASSLSKLVSAGKRMARISYKSSYFNYKSTGGIYTHQSCYKPLFFVCALLNPSSRKNQKKISHCTQAKPNVRCFFSSFLFIVTLLNPFPGMVTHDYKYCITHKYKALIVRSQ